MKKSLYLLTAAFGDSLLGVERLLLASEGAIRSNLGLRVDALFRLDISPLAVR